MSNNFDMKQPMHRGSRFGDNEAAAALKEEVRRNNPTTSTAKVVRTEPAVEKLIPTRQSNATSTHRTISQRLQDIVNKLPLPKYCPLKRYGVKKVFLSVVIIALLATGGWFGYRWLTAPAQITDLHFERSLSSRTTDAPTKQDFTPGEPLMLVMSYAAAKPQTKATIIIAKDGQDIRTIDIPQLRGDEKTADHGKRYVSLVNGTATKLEAGTYTARVVLNGSYAAATATFTVK
ncbi:MAG: hypothetical protein Q4A34_03950 [Candidatus Saccharibacteria bacterium]|nr:hypothetical protein [Candidatus Saccharibacteria bacterium]